VKTVSSCMQRVIITRQSPTKDQMYDSYRAEKDADMARRYQAIFLLLDGKSKNTVAKITGISKRTLLRWIHRFNEAGIEGLKPAPIPGRQCRLTAEQIQELNADLQKNPRELGYDFSNWDGKKIKYHIEQKFGVKFGVRRVQVMMHEMDFSLQRPRPVPAKADPAKQEVFKTMLDEKKRLNLDRTTFSCI